MSIISSPFSLLTKIIIVFNELHFPTFRRGEKDRQERERGSDWRKSQRSLSPATRNTPEKTAHDEPPPKKKKEDLDPILTRTGGAYIPPAKLRMMQAQITDKNRCVKHVTRPSPPGKDCGQKFLNGTNRFVTFVLEERC